jgi:hypothetical protein
VRQVFVPLAPHLLAIFTASELARPPRSSTSKPPNFRTTLHLSTATLSTSSMQQALVQHVLRLLLRTQSQRRALLARAAR